METGEIEIDEIEISEFNTRKDMKAGTEDVDIQDLADSIKKKGLLTPIIVTRRADGKYELIAGQRRYRACSMLGMKTIPAIIREISDSTDATIISLTENIHRADMNPIDKASAFKVIYEKYQNYEKVVEETNISIATIRKYMNLLNLDSSIQEELTTKNGPAGIATMAKIATTFEPEIHREVLDMVSGFNQETQLEMIKVSGGDLNALEKSRESAIQGRIGIRICRGIESLEECDIIQEFLSDEQIIEIKNIIEKK